MSGGPSPVRGVGTGLGKLILCGEHAVVHGHPALAFAVDRCTTVALEARPGPTEIVSTAADARLAEALAPALEPAGWQVRIDSEVPVGRGMGSSAALAVALVRALAAAHGEDLDADAVFERAMPVERVFHGNPSGLDVAVSARGGILRYVRGTPPTIEALPVASRWQVVVLDSGEVGNTAELVAGVASRRPGIDPVLDRIGALAAQAVALLDDPPALGELLSENHALLRRIGVSNERLDDLVTLALEAGAHGAKLAGAGGGGVVLALVDDPEPLLRAARRRDIPALVCQLAEAR